MFYTKNVPGWERAVRVIAGVLVAILALATLPALWGALVAVLAAGIVASGLVGFCPMCALVGRKLDARASRQEK